VLIGTRARQATEEGEQVFALAIEAVAAEEHAETLRARLGRVTGSLLGSVAVSLAKARTSTFHERRS
jgi:hypothetical protein